jgi:uncharacterized protein (TIGR03435 family)
LTLHREAKDLPIYALVIGNNGPKMKESALDPVPKDHGGRPPRPPGRNKEEPDLDADGFPNLALPAGGRGGIVSVSLAGLGNRIRAQQATMREFVNELMKRQLLGCPVKDETALQARYDFVLTFSSMGLNRQGGPVGDGTARSSASPAEARVSLPDLFQAVQLQLEGSNWNR